MDEFQVEDLSNQYMEDFKHLCALKAADFHLLGYEQVTADEVWQCVLKMTKGKAPLYVMVETILGLDIGRFMTHATINAYQGIFGSEPES